MIKNRLKSMPLWWWRGVKRETKHSAMLCCHVEGAFQGCAHEGSTVPTWAPYQSQVAMGAISESHKEQESGDIQGGKGDALRRFPGRWGMREASRNCADWTWARASFTLSPWKPSQTHRLKWMWGTGQSSCSRFNSVKNMKLWLLSPF